MFSAAINTMARVESDVENASVTVYEVVAGSDELPAEHTADDTDHQEGAR